MRRLGPGTLVLVATSWVWLGCENTVSSDRVVVQRPPTTATGGTGGSQISPITGGAPTLGGTGGALGGNGGAFAGANNEGGAAGSPPLDPECSSSTDCPSVASVCASASCVDGRCEVAPAPLGMFVAWDQGPCLASVCDGAGQIAIVPDTSHVPPFVDDCQVRSCAATGELELQPAPVGTSCSKNDGHLCDDYGSCVECLNNADCSADETCAARKCVPNVVSCSDGFRNGTETDVDCGGTTCVPCSLGLDCYQDKDCTSHACNWFAPQRCVQNHCFDHHMNADETDVDCGGSLCPACGDGRACLVGSDCQTGVCRPFHYCLPAHCQNQVQDSGEMGVDCGGGNCDGCPLGNPCVTNFDCQSLACEANSQTCIADQCQDHHVDNDESDVDCGGTTCAPCPMYKKCKTTADCVAGTTCPATQPQVCL